MSCDVSKKKEKKDVYIPTDSFFQNNSIHMRIKPTHSGDIQIIRLKIEIKLRKCLIIFEFN